MLNTGLKYNPSGLPVLSRRQIDNITESLLRDFNPAYMKTVQAINVDLFIREYLGLKKEEMYLSHKGIYLGMMVFKDTEIPIYDPVKKEAEFASIAAGTIIIDGSLKKDKQEFRYRYTEAHEAGHAVMHRLFYEKNDESRIACRTGTENKNPGKEWSDYDWMEWQANAFASAFLMPRQAVVSIMQNNKKSGAKDTMLSFLAAGEISRKMNVSRQAAAYRLKSLGLIDQNPVMGPLGVTFR